MPDRVVKGSREAETARKDRNRNVTVALVAALVVRAFILFLDASNSDNQGAGPETVRAGRQTSGPTNGTGGAANKPTASISDGTWKAGLDFRAGTHRAPGGEGCYYALLGSASSQDMIDSGFAELNPTVAITSPWFETQDCGLWEKLEQKALTLPEYRF